MGKNQVNVALLQWETRMCYQLLEEKIQLSFEMEECHFRKTEDVFCL